jgi:hypothetical protein
MISCVSRCASWHGRRLQAAAVIIDSQSVKAADTLGKDSRGYDAGKRTGGRKRHLAVDVLGLTSQHRRPVARSAEPWSTVTPAAAGGSFQVKMVARTSNAMWRCSLTAPRWSGAAATTQPGHSPA